MNKDIHDYKNQMQNVKFSSDFTERTIKTLLDAAKTAENVDTADIKEHQPYIKVTGSKQSRISFILRTSAAAIAACFICIFAVRTLQANNRDAALEIQNENAMPVITTVAETAAETVTSAPAPLGIVEDIDPETPLMLSIAAIPDAAAAAPETTIPETTIPAATTAAPKTTAVSVTSAAPETAYIETTQTNIVVLPLYAPFLETANEEATAEEEAAVAEDADVAAEVDIADAGAGIAADDSADESMVIEDDSIATNEDSSSLSVIMLHDLQNCTGILRYQVGGTRSMNLDEKQTAALAKTLYNAASKAPINTYITADSFTADTLEWQLDIITDGSLEMVVYLYSGAIAVELMSDDSPALGASALTPALHDSTFREIYLTMFTPDDYDLYLADKSGK
jgi:hypothetical protein